MQNVEASLQRAAEQFKVMFKVKSLNVAEPDSNPTLEEMLQYDAILIFSDARFHDPEVLGNRLADYVDHGKGVVFATFANCANNLQLRGRFVYESFKYLSLSIEAQKNLGADKSHLIKKVLPTHAILRDVERFDAGIYRSKCSPLIRDGIHVIAEWEDGVPCIAESSNVPVVTLNFFPVNSLYLEDCWKVTTDGDRVLFNALMHVSSSERNHKNNSNN